MFNWLKHKHEFTLLNIRTGQSRTVTRCGVTCHSAMMFWMRACLCGEFRISFGGENQARIEGKIPACYNRPQNQYNYLMDLLKDLGYSLEAFEDQPWSNYVI